jgi:hypothetical protein
MTQGLEEYHGEAEMAGFYAGGVLGALFIGAVSDILSLPPHPMVWYALGAVGGGFAGAIAAVIFRRTA